MPTQRLPSWFRRPYQGAAVRGRVHGFLDELKLNTVCESAACPNRCQCWARGTATFLILGNHCTRNCRFCAVAHGTPRPPEPDEPERVAEAAARLRLRFAVITSVTRDDLPDGGAAHFAATLRAVHARLPETGTEVLTPDFQGREADIAAVLAAAPEVFNHNLETCERLTPRIRSGADYRRSLGVLAAARRLAGTGVILKSGIMLGLGETEDEIRTMLGDLRTQGVASVTIGQYLPPSSRHWPLERYVSPEEFTRWGETARREFGFAHAVSEPLARSSYLAESGWASPAACKEEPARVAPGPDMS